MDGNSRISKVTVEYHDPSGVFPLLSRSLQSHLPLRDLHWKSVTRPLRSIDFLHVDVVAAKDGGRPGSRNGLGGTEDGSPVRTPGERRHQIPGLRQTPYLKIYLLRCDDSETYKSTARKTLREWLKLNTPASQTSSSKNLQENHDAFEWLILHVVLPNTGAASQPRTNNSSSKSEGVSSEKGGSSSKLLGRSSSTILDKIKADFNIASKTAPDRVAQIRLQADELPPNLIPAKIPGSPADYAESPQDLNNAWQDVVGKFKTLILLSFNLRVSQYEEDIRERDAQRSLPGWNFCTFFMLKEGLARGFESVGLVDDALIGYDELSLGLENAISESDDDGTTTRSDSFLKYTKEMKDILLQCLTSESTPDVVWKAGTKIVSAARKDYRNLIVNSNVSLFDFQCYIFARQMTILLRMGIRHSSERPQSRPGFQQREQDTDSSDDLAPLTELCQRAANFLSAATRTLRDELYQAAQAQRVQAPSSVIENIAASWAFGVAEQVLESTNIPALLRAETLTGKAGNHQTMDRLQHPQRRSSLTPRNPLTQQQDQSDDPLTALKRLEDKLSMPSNDDELKAVPISDLETLAGNRADLLLLQRQITERIAETKAWRIGLKRLQSHAIDEDNAIEEIDLSNSSTRPDDDSRTTFKHASHGSELDRRGVLYAVLIDAVSSFENLTRLFERLTRSALSQCLIATRTRAIERLTGDLAVVKYDAGDFVTAANYLSKVTPSFAEHGWGILESELAKLHAQCLKRLNRRDEYARILLTFLSKAAARQQSFLRQRVQFRTSGDNPWLDDDFINPEGVLVELLSSSEALPRDIVAPFEDFFTELSIDPYIHLLRDEDGFSIDLKLRHLLEDDLTIDSVRLKLKGTDPPFREIWVQSSKPLTLEQGINRATLFAPTTCYGLFTIEKLALKSKKISFETELKRTTPLTIAGQLTHVNEDINDTTPLARLPQLLCYGDQDAVDVKVSMSHEVYIDQIRTLDIVLSTGRNVIEKAQLTLRAGSAGLRLRTAEAIVVEEAVSIARTRTPGVIDIHGIAKRLTVMIKVPFDLESTLPQISIGVDFSYTTGGGDFQFFANANIVSELALDVSVHDLFRSRCLYSRYQIRAARGVPIHVNDVELSDSDRFSVQGPPRKVTPMLVLPTQDGVILYKVTPKDNFSSQRQSEKDEKPLLLRVDYTPLNDLLVSAVEKSLTSVLSSSAHVSLQCCLLKLLLQPLQYLTSEKLEEVAILNQLHLPTFEHLGWIELLAYFDLPTRNSLTTLLKKWHAANQIISIPRPGSSDDDEKEGDDVTKWSHVVKITVPLPRLNIQHTARLTLSSSPSYVSQGSVLPATIVITHTRRWDSSMPTHPLDFVLEIDGPVDTWLIGGQRRTRFSATEDEEKSFTIMLIPLRTGHLLLPSVSVRMAMVKEQGAEVYRCETDYRSNASTVLVVADVKAVTIGVGEIAAGREVVVLSKERRE